MSYKQVILIRTDLKLPKGKACAQVAHASVDAVLKSDKKKLNAWLEEGMKKVVLKVKNEEELLDYLKKAKNLKLTTSLITDKGLTVVAPGTRTCGAIGPDFEDRIDVITGKLKIL